MELKVLILVATFLPYYLTSHVPDTQGNHRQENPAIYRPCGFQDYRCIGNILQANSNCNRAVNGYIPHKFVVPLFHFVLPYFNVSYTETSITIRNLDRCHIVEFYINPVTDRAVLGIDCHKLDYEADRTFLRHKSLGEDKVCHYHSQAIYPLIRITLVLKANRMELSEASILTEVLELPKYYLKSLDEDKSDSEVTTNVKRDDLSPLGVFETESFYQRGIYIARRFVQSFLCDYGYFLID